MREYKHILGGEKYTNHFTDDNVTWPSHTHVVATDRLTPWNRVAEKLIVTRSGNSLPFTGIEV